MFVYVGVIVLSVYRRKVKLKTIITGKKRFHYHISKIVFFYFKFLIRGRKEKKNGIY